MPGHDAEPGGRPATGGHDHEGLFDHEDHSGPEDRSHPENLRDPDGLRDHEVELRMAVSDARVSVIRALAADAALREDFDLDAIADVRLAVNEVCAAVLAHADRDSVLTCRLLGCDHRIEFGVTAGTSEPQPATAELSWHLMRVLTDTIRYWTTGSGDHNHLHVRFTKFRDSGQSLHR